MRGYEMHISCVGSRKQAKQNVPVWVEDIFAVVEVSINRADQPKLCWM
jgi:hypothetical protein